MQYSLLLTVFLVLSITLSGQASFTLKSNGLGGQATKKHEFNAFGGNGDNVSPDLFWENVPEGTKSFAITMYDPDAPTGSGWWHWLVFNIPKNVTKLVENAGNITLNLAPKGSVQSLTDYGTTGYGGPCPPVGHGFHRYIITIYALKAEKLELKESTNPAVVGYYLWKNTIEKASIITYYKR